MKRKSVLLKSIQQEAQEKEKKQEKLEHLESKEIENISIKPKDYKKIVGIVGVENSGKSLISLLAAWYIYSKDKNNVSILDLSENQNYSYYFITDQEEEELFNQKGFMNVRGINILTKDYFGDNTHFQKLDNLRQNNDLVIINCGNNIDTDIVSMIDNLYIVSDSDQTHIIAINNLMKILNNYNINENKVKIIFNKMIDNQFSKQLAELSIYDLKTKDKIYKKIPDIFSIDLVTDKDVFKLINDFDVRALEKDETLNKQLSKIANDMYSLNIKGNNLIGNIKSIFKKL